MNTETQNPFFSCSSPLFKNTYLLPLAPIYICIWLDRISLILRFSTQQQQQQQQRVQRMIFRRTSILILWFVDVRRDDYCWKCKHTPNKLLRRQDRSDHARTDIRVSSLLQDHTRRSTQYEHVSSFIRSASVVVVNSTTCNKKESK